MRGHVLLNLLSELGVGDKMRCLQSILSCVFCNEFNKCNNTRARMLDAIYHITRVGSRYTNFQIFNSILEDFLIVFLGYTIT